MYLSKEDREKIRQINAVLNMPSRKGRLATVKRLSKELTDSINRTLWQRIGGVLWKVK